MNQQTQTLFNQSSNEIQTIKKETEQAIEEGLNGAHEKWRAMALECVMDICKKKREFTMNDVRGEVQKSPIKTHDNRAMAGVIVTAKKLGWVKPSGRSIMSRVVHKSPLQIWQSLIYQGGE